MAKTRMINTRFWGDGYVSNLDPMEKLLFLYLLTNQYTNICGIYELPLRTMVFDTQIEEDTVKNILSRFGVDGKIKYTDGWVIIKNFAKHQNQGSPKIIRGIELELKQIPEHLRKEIYPIDTLSHLNSNLNSNLNSKEVADAPSLIFERKILDKSDDYRALVKDLAARDYLSVTKIHQIATEEFLPHWLERSEGAKKARWEKEKAFEYQRRFRTWIANFHKYAKDYRCKNDMWHRNGDSCHCEPSEPTRTGPLVPSAASLVRELALGKTVT